MTTTNLNPTNDNAGTETQESQPQMYTCANCQKQGTADSLFVPSIQRMQAAKDEREGTEFFTLTRDDLVAHMVCEDCKVPKQTYYLVAMTMAKIQDRQDRSNSIAKAMSVVTPGPTSDEAPQLPAAAPELDAEAMAKEKAEAEEIVSCCYCEEEKMPRKDAIAAAFTGCQLQKAGRLQQAGLTTKPYVHVSSEDLLKSGPEGYVVGPRCMEVLLPMLKEAARNLGMSESDIAKSIKPFRVMGMIKGARAQEEKKIRDDAARLQADADRKAAADEAARDLAERTERLRNLMRVTLPQTKGKRR